MTQIYYLESFYASYLEKFQIRSRLKRNPHYPFKVNSFTINPLTSQWFFSIDFNSKELEAKMLLPRIINPEFAG